MEQKTGLPSFLWRRETNGVTGTGGVPMRTKASAGKIRQTYEFIKANRKRFDVRTMCRVLEVAPSGYYA
jgi:hypothetical protein